MEFELRKNENNRDYEKQTTLETNSEKIELGRKIAGSYNSVQIKQFCKKYICNIVKIKQNNLTEELDEIKMNLFAVKEETNNSCLTVQPTLETFNRLQSTTKLKVVTQTESNIYSTMDTTSKKNFDIKSPRIKPDQKLDMENDKVGLVERKEKKLQVSSLKFIGKFGSVADKNKLPEEKRVLSHDLNDEGDKLVTLEDNKPIMKLKSKKNNAKNFSSISKKEAGEEESDVKKSTAKLETTKKGRLSILEDEKKEKDEGKKSIKYLHAKKVIKKKKAKEVNMNESGDFKTLETENNDKLECQHHNNQEILATLNDENQRYADEDVDKIDIDPPIDSIDPFSGNIYLPVDNIDIDPPTDSIDPFTTKLDPPTNNIGIDPPNDNIDHNYNTDSFSGLTEGVENNGDADDHHESNKSDKVKDINNHNNEYDPEEYNIEYNKSIAENYMTNFN